MDTPQQSYKVIVPTVAAHPRVILLCHEGYADLGKRIFDMFPAQKVANQTGQEICLWWYKPKFFPDGEVNIKLDGNVRNAKVVYIHPVISTNDSFMEFTLMNDALQRSSVSNIIGVWPYYSYARQDRKDGGRVPISAKAVANQLSTTRNLERIITCDLHAGQIQGFVDIPADNLYSEKVFAQYLRENCPDVYQNLGKVCAADAGGIKRCEGLAEQINAFREKDGISKRVGVVIAPKVRKGDEEVRTYALDGGIEGQSVLMYDDIISTGGTMLTHAATLRAKGATAVYCAAVHAAFNFVERRGREGLAAKIAEPFDILFVSDSIPRTVPDVYQNVPDIGQYPEKIKVFSLAPLITQAIHSVLVPNESLSAMFKPDGKPIKF